MSTVATHSCEHDCGTWMSYQHTGCRCDGCRTAWSVYQHRLTMRHDRGEVWADRSEVLRLTRPFRSANITVASFSRAMGFTTKAGARMLAGKKIRAHHVEALRALSWNDFHDGSRVDAQIVRDLMAELRERGYTNNSIATDVLGWATWPNKQFTSGRAAIGTVRKLEFALGRTDHGWHGDRPCRDCDGVAFSGGVWCEDCFAERTTPNLRDLDDMHRRRERAERKRKERARRREEVA